MDQAKSFKLSFFNVRVEINIKVTLATFSAHKGAYSDSQGVEGIRNNVAKYIRDRDGYDADPGTIYLTSGASEAIRVRFQFLVYFIPGTQWTNMDHSVGSVRKSIY